MKVLRSLLTIKLSLPKPARTTLFRFTFLFSRTFHNLSHVLNSWLLMMQHNIDTKIMEAEARTLAKKTKASDAKELNDIKKYMALL